MCLFKRIFSKWLAVWILIWWYGCWDSIRKALFSCIQPEWKAVLCTPFTFPHLDCCFVLLLQPPDINSLLVSRETLYFYQQKKNKQRGTFAHSVPIKQLRRCWEINSAFFCIELKEKKNCWGNWKALIIVLTSENVSSGELAEWSTNKQN